MLLTDIAQDPEYADLDYQVAVGEFERLDPSLRQTMAELLAMGAGVGKVICARLSLRDMMGGMICVDWCSSGTPDEYGSIFSAVEIASMRSLIVGQPVSQRLHGEDTTTLWRHSIAPRGAPIHGEIALVIRGEAPREMSDRLRSAIRVARNMLAAHLRHMSDTRRLAAVYLASPTLGYLLDGSGAVVAVTEMFLQHFGYAREDVLGRNARHFMAEQTRREFARVRETMWRNGGCRDYPCKFVANDGREVDVLMSASVEFNAQGWPVNVKCALTDVSELLRLQRELASSRRTDALTGACNGESFAERVALELSRARRHARQLVVAVFELRHFDVFSARQGAAEAGRLLASIVVDMRASLRAGDEIARIGGSRFAILLAEVSGDAKEGDMAAVVAATLHERLLDSFSQNHAQLGVCMGVAANHDDPPVEVLLARANLALQRAIQGHRSICVWAERESQGGEVGDAAARADAATTLAEEVPCAPSLALARDAAHAIAGRAIHSASNALTGVSGHAAMSGAPSAPRRRVRTGVDLLDDTLSASLGGAGLSLIV
ncbi:MAG: diguanylate cyclase [Burkholderiaceae bacterium]